MNDEMKKIDRLMTRKLDGVLSDEQRADLDEAKVRNPAIRNACDSTEAVDALCASVLSDVLGSNPAVEGADVMAARASSVRRFDSGIWWIVPGALAACLGWMMINPVLNPPSDNQPMIVLGEPDAGPYPPADLANPGPAAYSQPASFSPRPSGANLIRPVSTDGQVMDRRRQSDHFGIIGDDGRIYLVELERTQFYRYPRENAVLVRESL